MMKRYNKGTYKVVEINNMTALRSGQMAAQTVAIKKSFPDMEVLENGLILGYGEVTPNGGAKTLGLVPYTEGAAIFLHYTEELFLENATQLNTFALEFEEGVAYPRALALNIGDVFTTNNVKGDLAEGIFIVDDGLLTAAGESAVAGDHIFYGIKSYLPDGETAAIEFTYMGVK